MADSAPSEPNRQQYNRDDDEIDIFDLWHLVLKRKWIVVGFTLLFSVASVFYALSLPNMYKSTVVLLPAESAQGGGLAGLAGQLGVGGIAALAGVNLGSSGTDKAVEALEILTSWSFIEEFIEEQGIAAKVFAVAGWDQEGNELIYDADVYDSARDVWTREPPKGKEPKPSSWELYQKFKEYLSVTNDSVKGFTNIEIEYYSAEISKKWVDALVFKINQRFKEEDARDAEKNILFLKQQIEETSLTSMQTVFFDLIEDQTKTLMLAEGSNEYVFRTVNEARVQEEKSGPKRALISIFGSILGLAIGCVVTVVRGLRVNSSL
jgi:LPS O-antigen subunit length determinant protein (WzzB/FepE family)